MESAPIFAYPMRDAETCNEYERVGDGVLDVPRWDKQM